MASALNGMAWRCIALNAWPYLARIRTCFANQIEIKWEKIDDNQIGIKWEKNYVNRMHLPRTDLVSIASARECEVFSSSTKTFAPFHSIR